MQKVHLPGWRIRHPSIRVVLCVFLCALVLDSCSAPGKDASTPLGKKAALDQTHNFLSTGECDKAIAAIDPIYNSSDTDNDVRLARSSAHACAAGLDFIPFTLGLVTAGSLSGSGFWKTLAKKFPQPNPLVPDSKVEHSWKAQDALFAAVIPGSVIREAYKVNNDYEAQGNAHNVGSIAVSQRVDDANLYLIYTSMATIGNLQNRYSGTNTETGLKTFPLGYKSYTTEGWQKIENMDQEGCSFAGSILTMFDSIEASSSLLGKLGDSLTQVTEIKRYINSACEIGCQGIVPGGYAGTGTGCVGIPVGACDPCPFELRNRNSCTNAVDNRAGCAAAGIAYFINNDTNFGWPGP